MLGISTTVAAAAYLLLAQSGHPAQVCRVGWDGDTVCTAIALAPTPPCQLTMTMSPPPARPPPSRGNHITVDWVGWHGHHHCHHWRHGRCHG